MIYPDGQEALKVYCNMKYGGFTLIMQKHKRETHNGAFNKSWHEYKVGFGHISAENYWLGLEHMHKLTNAVKTDIYIEYYHFGELKYERYYSNIKIGPEIANYNITLGDDQFSNPDHMSGVPFITFDNTIGDDNELNDLPAYFQAGWWFKKEQMFCITCDSHTDKFVLYMVRPYMTQENNSYQYGRIKMYLRTSITSKK